MAANVGPAPSEMNKSIWVVYQDKKKNYWFGSNGNGAYCYDGKNLKQFTTNDGLHSDKIRGIQEDKSGNIYFDTPNGVSRFDGDKFTQLIPVRSETNQWKLRSEDLWFKGNGEITGAYRYDGNTLYHLDFSSFNSKWIDPDYAVYSIYKDKEENIWFGTLSAGVCCFNGVTLNWIYEKELSVLDDGRVPAVRNILEDNDGFFWFSNILSRYKILSNDQKNQGTIEYEKVNGIELSQQQVKMKLPYFNSAVIDNENVWMTSYNEGVWKYDGKKLTNFQIKDGEVNALIVSIYKDNAGVLWLGTDNSGVYTFNGRTFEKFKL
ncbi:ligand-binding sensor domain-containing protein [Polluticoccus soli]|uniref:ligand-binding sensor domain-containing protein n=1 Tax=Polluticoccus soli TaxID=3034150 RepID=UPI0023E21D69|nr:two-component regulator propeller domain-containing protein [Flavipsychrobacter sp. JY13-12]